MSVRTASDAPVIRAARKSDIADLVEIESAFPGDRLNARSFERLIASATAHVGVAEGKAGEIVGYFAMLFRTGSRLGRVYSLVVADGRTGRGFGRALLVAAEQEAARRNIAEIRLEVREDNAIARQLYASAGFRLLANLPDYYEDGGAALRMAKLLLVAAAPDRSHSGYRSLPARRR